MSAGPGPGPGPVPVPNPGPDRFCPQAIYVYQKAAILSMMSEEEQKKTGEDVGELFRSGGRRGHRGHPRTPVPQLTRPCPLRQVEGLKQRLAGKSIPTEKFAVRKSRRYKGDAVVPLVVPALVGCPAGPVPAGPVPA